MSSIIDKIFNEGEGDAALILGGIQFGHLEVPNNFNFGTTQLTQVHQLVGGARVVDSMGQSPHNIAWSGMFYGENASERARYLDYLTVQGEQVQLTFGEFQYSVVIQSFSAKLERFYQVPYSIALIVVQNLTAPVQVALPNGYNDALENDLSQLIGAAAQVGNAGLINSIANISSALSAAGNVSTATPQQIDTLQQTIAAAQVNVQALILANGG